MSVDQGVETLSMTLSPRPRDWTSKVDTWEGKGRQGEGKGEESDPWRPACSVAATAAAAETEFDAKLEPVDEFSRLGVDLVEEALPLPVP